MSGKIDNYYRYYNPETGRYITSDPVGLNGGLNTYGYVGGNPVGLSDPTGEFIWIPYAVNFAIGAAAGAWAYWINYDTHCNGFNLKEFLLAAGAGGVTGMVAPTSSISRMSMLMISGGLAHVSNVVKYGSSGYPHNSCPKEPECE